jgi:divalent metal cation (Fe/Co/Zn/Cd) transporter
MRAIGASFFALALYVAVTALRDLLTRAHPDVSAAGMVVTALSLLVMPWLARRKHKVGHELNMPTLIADSAQTRLCAYLSAATLAGLALNAIAGWWWADPLAAMVVAGLALNEGREAWSGDHHC